MQVAFGVKTQPQEYTLKSFLPIPWHVSLLPLSHFLLQKLGLCSAMLSEAQISQEKLQYVANYTKLHKHSCLLFGCEIMK